MLQIKGNTRWERFLSAVQCLDLRFPNSEIVKKTGYSKSQVSAYLNPDSQKEPSENFLRTFSEQFGVDFSIIWTGVSEGKSIKAAEPEIKSPIESDDYRAERIKKLEEDQAKYIRKLEEDNEKLWSLVKDNQNIIKTNLTLVLATVRTISIRQEATGEVTLESLARLEKKPKGSLVEDEDKKRDQISKRAFDTSDNGRF